MPWLRTGRQDDLGAGREAGSIWVMEPRRLLDGLRRPDSEREGWGQGYPPISFLLNLFITS